MNYEQDITRILLEAGSQGLPVKKIVRHVYNSHNGLFDTLPYDDVRKAVAAAIAKNSKTSNGIFESAGKRGYYRINKASRSARQLMLDFDATQADAPPEPQPESKPCEDKSLSLF